MPGMKLQLDGETYGILSYLASKKGVKIQLNTAEILRIYTHNAVSTAPICPIHQSPLRYRGVEIGWRCERRMGDKWCDYKPQREDLPMSTDSPS